jgi:hypothetical protein
MVAFIPLIHTGFKRMQLPTQRLVNLLRFILSTSQRKKRQNQSPEWDLCQLQMKKAQNVSSHRMHSIWNPRKVQP